MGANQNFSMKLGLCPKFDPTRLSPFKIVVSDVIIMSQKT
jgi:hypothetical protein